MERVLRRMGRRSLVAGSGEALESEAQDVCKRLAEASAALKKLREVHKAVEKLTKGGRKNIASRSEQRLLMEVESVGCGLKDAVERFQDVFKRKKQPRKKVVEGYAEGMQVQTKARKRKAKDRVEDEKVVEKQKKEKKGGEDVEREKVEAARKTEVCKHKIEKKSKGIVITESKEEESETESEGRVEEEQGDVESSESEYEDEKMPKSSEVMVIEISDDDISVQGANDNEAGSHEETESEQVKVMKEEQETEYDVSATPLSASAAAEAAAAIRQMEISNPASDSIDEQNVQRLDLSASAPEPQVFEDNESPLWLSANSSESDEDFPVASPQEEEDEQEHPAVPKGHATTISSDSDSSDDSSESGEELDSGSLTTDYAQKLAESLGGSGDKPPEYAPVPGRQPLSRSHPPRSPLLPLARACLKRAANPFSLEHSGWRDDVAIVRQLLSSIGESKEDKESLALVARMASKAVDQLNRRLRRADPALFTRLSIDGILRSIKEANTARPDVRQYLERRIGEVGQTAMGLMSNERWRPDYPRYWSLALQADYVTPIKMAEWASQLVKALEEAFVWSQPSTNDLERIIRAAKLLILPLADLSLPQLKAVIEAADFQLFLWSISNFSKLISSSSREIAKSADRVAERLAAVLDRVHAL